MSGDLQARWRSRKVAMAAVLRGATLCLLSICVGLRAQSAPAQAPAVLEFLDGAYLHGRLLSMYTHRGVGWECPEARQLIEFRPGNIASIIFEGARPISARARPTCRFRFHNGDELYGNLLRMD